MVASFKLTVDDLLKHPHFREADVVAGQKGLNRTIRWIHIMEVAEIGQLLNGNEVILSTGVGWRENQRLGCSFLRQLIDKKVSGLCVELGTYISSIPKQMIELAEQHDFPLIVFRKEVRFIDITQDLNGLLMETHYKMMSDLETFSNQLNHLLLSTDGFKGILRLLHQYLNVQVAYIPMEGEPQFYPPVEQTKKTQLLTLADASVTEKLQAPSAHVAKQPIQALGHQFADLVIYTQSEEWTDFDFLVLDRTATALAQDQLRVLYVEEKRRHQEHRWLQKWLNGEHRKEEIEQHLSSLKPSLKWNGCTVCLCEWKFSERIEDPTYYSMIFRSIFEQRGFFSITLNEGSRTIIALVNQRNQTDWKSRLTAALNQIRSTELMKDEPLGFIDFGVGKLVKEPDHIHESYQMAREALYIHEKIGKSDSPFYEDLHIFRLISKLNQDDTLRDLVVDYLGPVLEFDAKHNSQMFETLKVFLEVNGSKKEAAERLFIVRQTLYHRIEKLKELIGEDFMQPEKRLAVEFAVHARQFLS